MGKVKDAFLGGAEKKAGKQIAGGFQASSAEFKKQGEEIRKSFDPFAKAGLSAFQQIAGLTGALGVEAEEEQLRAQERFAQSPGQRFLRDRQEKSLLRNAAAIGGLGGGNVRTALQEQAAGIAAQQRGQRLAELGFVSDVGQSALSQQAQSRQFQTGGVSQGLIGAAQARASGTLGEAAGIRQTVTQGAQAAGSFMSDERLKTDIKTIGVSQSGINIYEFKYIDDEEETVYQGVIAQELLDTHPKAVVLDDNGMYSVRYSLIDVDFKKVV
jgi:hypothetical protein